MPSGVFDPRGAEAYLTVRRAPRGEKTSLRGMHRRPQQETGEKCGLVGGRDIVVRCRPSDEGGADRVAQSSCAEWFLQEDQVSG